jgi:hypothetical protein
LIATADAEGEGQLVNLSRAGAGVLAAPGLAPLGAAIALSLEGDEQAPPMLLRGEVVRLVPRGDQVVYGVHFDPMPPDEEQQWIEYLRKAALGRGVGRRRHPRTHQNLDLRCHTEAEFQATLSDISLGGLALKCAVPLQVGQPIRVGIGVDTVPALVELEGSVAWVKPAGEVYRVGVQFAPPPAKTLTRLKSLIEMLLGLGTRQAVVEDD